MLDGFRGQDLELMLILVPTVCVIYLTCVSWVVRCFGLQDGIDGSVRSSPENFPWPDKLGFPKAFGAVFTCVSQRSEQVLDSCIVHLADCRLPIKPCFRFSNSGGFQ